MLSSLSDFAFVHQGKIIRSLSAQEAHFLSPIDQVVTSRHDKALLLLHGFASSPAVYRAMLPHITGYDRIVCPVLPGHGSSIQAFSQSTAQDWQDTAHACCAKLVDAYTQVDIVGLSLGGSLALELSQAFHIHHLYLLAPALKLQYSALLAYWGAKILNMLGWKSLVNHGGDFFSNQYQELTYRRLPLPAIIEILAYIQSQPSSQPTCPTDLFLGRYDAVIDVQEVAKHFAHHPQVKTHWLEHSAHVLPLDGDVDVLLQCINR